MAERYRLTAFMTHPVQYFSPWFQFIAAEVDELDLSVVYVTEPSAKQQGEGFNASFQWDTNLRDGYDNSVLRESRPTDSVHSDDFFGLDAPGIGRLLDTNRPDAVLLSGWHSLAQVRAMLACRKRSIPLLYRGDTYFETRRVGIRGAVWRIKTKWLLSRFDHYLSVGIRTRAYFEQFGVPDRAIFDSPHAVDNAFFERQAAPFRASARRASSRREWGLGPDDFVALFVGKLEPKKRPRDFLRALSRLGPGSTALVVGDGALAKACRELSERDRTRVVWKGFLNQGELGRAYGISDCLVLPSMHGESWGLVVNEAMATGLPCVVSDRVGCAPDLVVPGETGDIFRAGDIEDLAAALERVRAARDDAHSVSRRCRERVDHYTFARAAAGLLAATRAAVSP